MAANRFFTTGYRWLYYSKIYYRLIDGEYLWDNHFVDVHIYICMYVYTHTTLFLYIYIYTIYIYTLSIYIYVCTCILPEERQWQQHSSMRLDNPEWEGLVGCGHGGEKSLFLTVQVLSFLFYCALEEMTAHPILASPGRGAWWAACLWGCTASDSLKWLTSTIYTCIIYIIFLWLCVWCVCVSEKCVTLFYMVKCCELW